MIFGFLRVDPMGESVPDTYSSCFGLSSFACQFLIKLGVATPHQFPGKKLFIAFASTFAHQLRHLWA